MPIRQPVHPDTVWHTSGGIVTLFIALQDVEADMGPTFFLPGTNTAEVPRRSISDPFQIHIRSM